MSTERRRVLRDDDWVRAQQRPQTDGSAPKATTLHARGMADAMQEQGGRFAAMGVPTVIGAGAPKYPAASGPWAQSIDEVVGPEPPTGEDINWSEPVGEVFEVEASMRAHSVRADPGAVAAPVPEATPSSSVTVERDASGSLSKPRSFKRRI